MSTANELAENMASVSINDSTNGATPVGAIQTDATAASADEGRRLYIGNLAYATTEGELKDFFKAYTIENTSIPVNPRTTRPVGYAFVDLATAQEAQAAIAELSGKEILERKVSVQLARKPEPAENKGEAVSGGEGASGGEGRKRGYGRGRGRGRGRGGRFGARGGRAAKEPNGEHAEGTPEGTPLADVTNEPGDAPKDAKSRPRVQKQRGPPEDGIPSKTKVMVANLPYDLSEEKLKELFAAYEPVSAKIALRPIPRFMVKKLQARGEPRKGRGFGFVTLGSEALQTKAVEEMHGKEIEGREIAVKVAIDSPGKEDDISGEEQATAEAPADAPVTA
ncbi:RNP domain-containing protein [Histoplasma capsulatum G186AR]|uniref:RNP domain-containing protein n=2 Tax=Ajellomyces capsulatus TaxID=5037 RepID=C0NDP9_AJECG|nr:RNP domain-containing protein [Histoplasma capsulatum G186AR]EEH10347.1 RNP domain-containing protein [Histoplasma capsulatum G186AR]KAG5290684.1 RNP domain-containing protein [Histoplasma capsulatum]QSS72612.1 RNP domain-containing protein [Histoplasma capsulatum G186AR]